MSKKISPRSLKQYYNINSLEEFAEIEDEILSKRRNKPDKLNVFLKEYMTDLHNRSRELPEAQDKRKNAK